VLFRSVDTVYRLDGLFNLAHDPATLIVAFDRIASNTRTRPI